MTAPIITEDKPAPHDEATTPLPVANGGTEPINARSFLPPLSDAAAAGPLNFPVELQRFARQVARVRPIFEVVFYIGSLAVGLASLAAALIGWWAFREYQVQNRVAARTQLLAAEHALSEREIEDGFYAVLHAELPASTPPTEYAARHLAFITNDPEMLGAPTAPALHDLIWSSGSWEKKDRADLQAVRRLHRHASAQLYHLQAAYDYRADRIISEGEWETWAGLASDIGPHPVLLAALHSTHQQRYLSREFAADLRRRLTADTMHRAVVEQYYPQMLRADWLSRFPSYRYGGSAGR